MDKFNIYDKVECAYFKTGCTLEAIIEAGHILTDDEVRKYFGIDESHHYWRRAHHSVNKVRRLVFDKCIIPDTGRFRIEPCYYEED